MLTRLKHHWKITDKELVLILTTFAITGITIAWLSKKISEWLALDKYGAAWWISEIMVLIFGYQVIILFVGYCLGMLLFSGNTKRKF